MKTSLRTATLIALFFCQSAFALPPLWEGAFNVVELNGTAGGAAVNSGPSGQADGRENIPLGFNFPFAGLTYNRISVDSDGGIVLTNANTTIDILPSVWNKASFQSGFSNLGEPVILPFNAELDQNAGGTVWYAAYNGVFNGFTGFRGVITWVDSSLVFFGASDISFQAILLDDGTIIFNYVAPVTTNWNTKTADGFVVGISEGDGTWPLGSQNLNVASDFGIDLMGYQIWCADDDPLNPPSCMQAGLGKNETFDLHDQSIVFNPDGTTGFLVSKGMNGIKPGGGAGGSNICAVLNPGNPVISSGGGGGGGAFNIATLLIMLLLTGLVTAFRGQRTKYGSGR